MAIADVLVRAAAELRERGWTQDDYGTPDGPKCVLGAINVAAGLPIDGLIPLEADGAEFMRMRSVQALANQASGYVVAELGLPEDSTLGYPLIGWNDDRVRTADQVIEVLERTAERVGGSE